MTEIEAVTAEAETPKDTIEVVSSTEEQATPDVAAKVEKEAAPQQAEPESQEQQRNRRNQQKRAQRERLIAETAAVKERNRFLEEQLKAKQAPEEQPKPEQPKPKKDLSKEPNILEYNGPGTLGDVLDYQNDMMEFKLHKFNETQQQASEAAEEQRYLQAFQEEAVAIRAEMPDFDTKVQELYDKGLIQTDSPLEKTIIRSGHAAEFAKHFIEYPADLQTLNAIRPELIPQALKQIQNWRKTASVKETPRQTQATPPIKPPGNTAKTDRSIHSYTQEEIENMPLSEFKKIKSY